MYIRMQSQSYPETQKKVFQTKIVRDTKFNDVGATVLSATYVQNIL